MLKKREKRCLTQDEIEKRVVFHKKITTLLLCIALVLPFLLAVLFLISKLTGSDYDFAVVLFFIIILFYYKISFAYMIISAMLVYLWYKKIMLVNIISFLLYSLVMYVVILSFK
ncbi:MAG: hypothetical protein LBF71_06150 [Campylobacteraceae bacterium]|jgi:hypothetical protein|nr:hypothetical protein [Campylobacteraceae bacterium]